MSENPQLAKNTLGSFESIIMGIAGTAPAFSVAVTTAAIVSAVGVLSVGSVLYCGFIMFGISTHKPLFCLLLNFVFGLPSTIRTCDG